MNDVVERIRELCKEQKTSITKLEKKLGYANGTIGKWKNAKKAPPLEKVIAVSKELKVSSDYILTGIDGRDVKTKEPAHTDVDGLMRELMDVAALLTPSDREQLLRIGRGYLASYTPPEADKE